jgi:hypothetical protein
MNIRSRWNTWVLVPISMAFHDLTILVAFREFTQEVARAKLILQTISDLEDQLCSSNFIVLVHDFIVAEHMLKHNKVGNSIDELDMQETINSTDPQMAKEWN